MRPAKRAVKGYQWTRKVNQNVMLPEYRNILCEHSDILGLLCLITSKRRCSSHLDWLWPFDNYRRLSKFGARQIWRKLAYILEQLATRVDEKKINEYSVQLIELLPELEFLFDRIDCLCKVGFILDALKKYFSAPNTTFEVNRMALRNFVDEYFTQLQCDLRPLSENSVEFTRITDYWKLGQPCEEWKVVNAYRIRNKIESRAYLKLNNRKLLWHASSGNNWVPIFRYGLCIERANLGLYGVGVYFADMACKSFNYSHDLGSVSNPTRLLLLCEVALGRTKRLKKPDPTAANYVNEPLRPSDRYKSCCSNGTFAKNLDGVVDESGAIWPTRQSHNVLNAEPTEYIIYDNTQAKMRYLVQIEKAWDEGVYSGIDDSEY